MTDTPSVLIEEPEFVEDDIEVLATAYAPTASQASLIQERCIARKQEIANIDNLIQELSERKWLLQRACDVANDLLSPIRKLPPELLTDIFMRCMPEITPKMLTVSNRTTRRRLYSSTTYEFNTKNHPNKMRRRLQEVCQRWSIVIDDTPALWSRLALDQALENPEVVEEWLEKSRETLLDIFMRPVKWFDGDREADFRMVLGYIRREMKRCRTLVVDVRGAPLAVPILFPNAVEEDEDADEDAGEDAGEDVGEDVGEDAGEDVGEDAGENEDQTWDADQGQQENQADSNNPFRLITHVPNLQVLALEKSEHQHIAQIFGDIDAPKLNTLVIKWYDQVLGHLSPATLNNLRRLTIELCDAPSLTYLPILSSCHNLEHLEWSDFDPPHSPDIEFPLDEEPDPPPLITLPNLKTLHFATEYNGDMLSMQFLLCLSTPSLESFTFRASEVGHRVIPLESINAFLRDGASRIRKLHFRNVDTTAQGIGTLLSRLTNLHTLTFSDDGSVDASLFQSLCPPLSSWGPETPICSCPSLHTLELLNIQFPPGPLVDLIYRRTRPDGGSIIPNPNSISCINIVTNVPPGPNDVLLYLSRTHSETVNYSQGTRRGCYADPYSGNGASGWGYQGGWGDANIEWNPGPPSPVPAPVPVPPPFGVVGAFDDDL